MLRYYNIKLTPCKWPAPPPHQLKAVVSDIPSIAEKEDHYFLPWLRIRGFNVAKAEELIKNVRTCVCS